MISWSIKHEDENLVVLLSSFCNCCSGRCAGYKVDIPTRAVGPSTTHYISGKKMILGNIHLKTRFK